MRRLLFGSALIVLLWGGYAGHLGVLAQEALTLTTPVTPTGPTTSTYTVRQVILLWDEQFIGIGLRDNNGIASHYSYTGAQATTLMIALNKANLSTISLQKRILQQLVADGKLPPGSVTGTPE